MSHSRHTTTKVQRVQYPVYNSPHTQSTLSVIVEKVRTNQSSVNKIIIQSKQKKEEPMELNNNKKIEDASFKSVRTTHSCSIIEPVNIEFVTPHKPSSHRSDRIWLVVSLLLAECAPC